MAKTPYTAFGSTVRVEPGPRRVEAVADAKTLDNSVTAAHYQVGQRDADGRPIVEGQPMAYLDWNAHNTPGDESGTAYYLYQEQTVPVLDATGSPLKDEAGKDVTEERWVEIRTYATEAAAHTAAEKLAARK